MTLTAMTRALRRMAEIAKRDGRYKVDAYVFVQQALAYAQFELGMGRPRPFGNEDEQTQIFEGAAREAPAESHLSGQQLCEAVRLYAADLYGLMAKVVLNSWGIYRTDDLGEIVYNLIEIGEMTKSEADRREDFRNLYDFREVFQERYQITVPEPDEK